MSQLRLLAAVVALGLAVGACGGDSDSGSASPSSAIAQPDSALCPPAPYDEQAIDLVVDGYAGNHEAFPGALPDPYGRTEPLVANLTTRPNPGGEGIIVTGFNVGNREGYVDYSRRVAAWLVLDGAVYPINAKAANDIGLLFDGMPESIQQRAGLTHSYKKGETMMNQLGLDDYDHERNWSGNPFVACPSA